MAKTTAKAQSGNRHAVVDRAIDLVEGEEERVEKLSIAKIRIDGGTQMRAALNDAVVADYAQAMEEFQGWGKFPAVVVYFDGQAHWLGDGFHRIAAATVVFREVLVPATIRPGTRRDAIKYAAKANSEHGLRRTNADKRRSVIFFLTDEEWGKLTDGEIARECAVSARMVGAIRAELIEKAEIVDTPVRVGGDGRAINVERIGRPPTPKPTPAQVPVSPRPLPAPRPEPVAMFTDLPAPQEPAALTLTMREFVVVNLDRTVASKLHAALSLNSLRQHLTNSESEALKHELTRVLLEGLQ